MGAEEKTALMQRLDIFLGKLKLRYHEIIESAKQPLEETIESLSFDTIILINIFTALRDQTVTQLGEKAESGFSKMSQQFYKLGFSGAEERDAMTKMRQLKTYLEIEFTSFETETYVKAAQKILSNVKEHVNEKKLHRCTQCGAELPINIYSFMSLNIKCESCGSINTYIPDDRVRALEYYVLNYFAAEKALPLKLAAIKEGRSGKEYWKDYFEYMMEKIPEKKDQYERTMNARLHDRFL